MTNLFVKMPDGSEFSIKGDTPRVVLIEGFKKLGCKTLNEFNALIKRAQICSFLGDFTEKDYPLPDEILT